MKTRKELVEEIKTNARGIFDNADSILGDEQYFSDLTVSFKIQRIEDYVPHIDIQRTFIPEKSIMDDVTYSKWIADKVAKIEETKDNVIKYPAYKNQEHEEWKIMKRFICDNGLWEKFLNSDDFINYLRDENSTVEKEDNHSELI